jgi:tetratricopeptide (TPR) repeat protein
MSELEEELDDYEEQQKQRAHRKKVAMAIGGALVVCVIGIGIGAKSCTGGRKDAARMQLRTAVAKFESNPKDPELAKAAAAEYEAAGQKAEAEKVRQKHEAAVTGGEKGREAELRWKLAADPNDDTALGQLVEIFLKRQDTEGARKIYTEYIERTPTPKRHSNFGAWLWRNGFPEQGAKELNAAIKGGADDPYTRGYLGLCYYDLGKKKEAQKLIDKAVEDGADLDTLRMHQYKLDQEIGAQPDPDAPPTKKPKKK